MTGVILPNTYLEFMGPSIFLAGPSRSAPLWQDESIDYIAAKGKNIILINPSRNSKTTLRLPGDEKYFPRQRAWERHYLEKSSKRGCIMFWLPGEASHACNKVYGAMTRIELGQWMTRHHVDRDVRLVIGTDGNFPEMHTIEYDLKQDAPDVPIHKTLAETCDAAVRTCEEFL
jgi:hypothetical protein